MSESYKGRLRGSVVGIPIDAIRWDTARQTIALWAAVRESRYVCICNVHSVVTAGSDAEFGHVIENADIATPDGAPVAWTLRKKGYLGQPRVNGPDLMWHLCSDAQASGQGVGLFGATPETLDLLRSVMLQQFPKLQITYVYSPPFRPLTDDETKAIQEDINRSSAGILFVGLGCPKQEKWMASQRGKINAVMIGVGAAFDYHAGTVSRAPKWMQANGLEWLHRLASEPRRLWKRYFVTNTVFILKTIAEIACGRFVSNAEQRQRS